MKLYSQNDNYKLYKGNMLDMLEVIEPNSIDSIITDPPYELNFMGKGWDNSGIAFQKETWGKCYEVLKSGGYLLAFGGSRTFHRIACAIEDAGFEIRDTIMWLYGSGFPKSMDISKSLDKRNGRTNDEFIELGNYLKEKITDSDSICARKIGFSSALVRFWKLGERIPNKETWAKLKNVYNLDDNFDWLIEREEAEREVIGTKKVRGKDTTDIYGKYKGGKVDITIPSTDLAKQWQGWGTALKPSFEPIIVARKPFKGSLVDNVIEHGVGGINIDECRVGNEKRTYKGCGKSNVGFIGGSFEKGSNEDIEYNANGRFPANTILTYDETDYDEVCGRFPNTKSSGGKQTTRNFTDYNGGNCNSYMNISNRKINTGRIDTGYIAPCDSGSASRYFMNCKYTGKDEEIWKQLLVNNVESNLEILKATKDNIVQMNVEDLLKELKDHYAKYVESQQDLTETSIVQDIVKMLTWDFKIETSQVIQDFILNYKECTQFLNLVQFVEKMDNIDTTQTTQNLLKLFGYVKNAITNYIVGNFTVNELDQKRYTYQPKASKKDRDEGLDKLESKPMYQADNEHGNLGAFYVKKAGGEIGDVQLRKNTHPTVKPTSLMQYLVRLVTPNGGTVLDPFNGSGSTGKAVMYENREKNKNYKYIGIELTEEYLPIAKARIEYVCNLPKEKDAQMTIFDFIEE